MAIASNGATDQALLISYLTLRKIVGLLGAALPFVVSLGAAALFQQGLQASISAYYYTGTRDVFVGMLWAIGIFLLSYRGYQAKDSIAGDVASVCAIGIALFPTTPPDAPQTTGSGAVHLVFATVFFLTLAYFSLFLFTKTNQPKPTARKLQRNKVYRACGLAILACLALILVDAVLPDDLANSLRRLEPRFWLESIAIVAFGISWLTKGEAILADEKSPSA